jgi:hypothetical protein
MQEVNIAVMVPGAVEIYCASFSNLMTVVVNEVKESGSCELWVDVDTGRWSCDNDEGIYHSAIPKKSLSKENLIDALKGVGWCIESNSEALFSVSFGNINSVVIGEENDND